MSYEFTGRYSPNQLASGLQTYGSTGAAMSPEQNNPVQMPQNKQKQYADPTDLEKQAVTANLNNAYGYTTGPSWLPQPNAKSWEDFSEQDRSTWLDKWRRENENTSRIQQNIENSRPDDNSWNDPIGNAAESSAFWADTAYDPNVYNPTARAQQYAAQKEQSDVYNQNGGWLKQGGMGGNELANVDFDTRYQQGGMGGNDLGDVNLTPKKLPLVDYAFTGRTRSPEQNSPSEQKGNWLQGITRNPINKDLAIMASNLGMPGMGKIWGANTAPTYSAAPNTTFGQKAAHVADNFVRNLPLIGTPYALATDLYRKSQADTDPFSRPAMQSNFEKWAPTVPYGNGMDMADPSYLQNMALAKAMADKGIGQQYAFTRRQ